MPARTRCRPGRDMASPDSWRPRAAARSARRSTAIQAARSIEPTASGGPALSRRLSLREADDGRVPDRQHAVNPGLEPAAMIEAAGVEEAAGAGIRLFDQATHRAEVGLGCTELTLG